MHSNQPAQCTCTCAEMMYYIFWKFRSGWSGPVRKIDTPIPRTFHHGNRPSMKKPLIQLTFIGSFMRFHGKFHWIFSSSGSVTITSSSCPTLSLPCCSSQLYVYDWDHTEMAYLVWGHLYCSCYCDNDGQTPVQLLASFVA